MINPKECLELAMCVWSSMLGSKGFRFKLKKGRDIDTNARMIIFKRLIR